MQGRFDEGLTLTKPFRQSAVDQSTAYDRAVAHEFFHSVGVEHHGESLDRHILLVIHGPDNPDNPAPAPQLYWGDAPIQILEEATGADLATQWYQATAAFARRATPLDNPWSHGLYVGWPKGQHSGDDQCVMRYSLAEIYPMGPEPPNPLIYYSVPAGTEPSGLQICSAGDGTGVNGTGHMPQSRYSAAAANHGSCKFWVCVNDKIPADPD